VWVNSQFIADHQGGHTPFTVDITPVLNEFGPQRVTAADDPMTWLNRGKQDWRLEPHSMWYPRTSGIWQTVGLSVLALLIPHSLDSGIRALGDWFEAFVAGEQHDGIQLKVKLSVGDQLLVNDTYVVLNGDSPAHSTFRPGIDDYRNGLL